VIWQLGSLLLVACVILTFAYFRQDAELALHLVHRTCRRAGLQWLDQSVHLTRLSYGWSGGPVVRRDYRFDFSADGQQRSFGYLRLEGPRLLWLFIETAEGAVYLEGQ